MAAAAAEIGSSAPRPAATSPARPQEFQYDASPNAAPGRQLGVVTGRRGRVEPSAKVWGLGANKWQMFNARSETAHRLPSFRKLYREGRGVAVIDGFYEWTEGALKKKQPHYASRPDGKPLLVAALCDDTSCTLLTRDVVADLAWLHDRMPVIFQDAAAARRWLDDDGLFAFDAPPKLKTYPVDPKMSKLSYQGDDASKEMKVKKVTDFFQKVPPKLPTVPAVKDDPDGTSDRAPALTDAKQDTRKRRKPDSPLPSPPSKQKKGHKKTTSSPLITDFFKKQETAH